MEHACRRQSREEARDHGFPVLKKPLTPRRLHVSHINIVDRPVMRKALGGTIVGNTMEWYDVGVFDT